MAGGGRDLRGTDIARGCWPLLGWGLCSSLVLNLVFVTRAFGSFVVRLGIDKVHLGYGKLHFFSFLRMCGELFFKREGFVLSYEKKNYRERPN